MPGAPERCFAGSRASRVSAVNDPATTNSSETGLLRRMIGSAGWLAGDQVIRLAGGFFVGLWVARFLGPEQFGLLNHATALVAMVAGVAGLGIHNYVVSELVRNPAERGAILGSALALRLAVAAVIVLVVVLVGLVLPTSDPRFPWLVAIAASSILFQAAEVFDWSLQAQHRMRASAAIRTAGFAGVTAAKVVLVLTRAPLFAFAVVTAAELLLYALGWVLVYRRGGADWRALRPTRERFAGLIRAGWVLALTVGALQVQAYFDQVLLGTWLGPAALGDYAAAFRIVMVAAFVPAVVQIVAGPELARAHAEGDAAFRRRMNQLYRAMLGLFVLLAAPLVLWPQTIVKLLYGASFSGAAAILPWLALRLFFANLGTIRGLYIANTGRFVQDLISAGSGALLNCVLNALLIPRFGVAGAIGASMASFAVTVFAFDWIFPTLRPNARMMARALAFPWRSV